MVLSIFILLLRLKHFTLLLTFRIVIVMACLAPSILPAQPDYDLMTSWAYHPGKVINLLANYNLDVAVIGPDLSVDSLISFENRATENTGVDVFFIHPTYLSGTYFIPSNVAINEQPVGDILGGIIGQGGLLAQYGRFYAPFYRQATPPTFLGTPNLQGQASALGTAYGDIRAAFINYLNTQSGGNDFILAGHSQGSYLLSMLLHDVIANDPELKSRMIAAVTAGMVSVYDVPGVAQGPGAWWSELAMCSEIAQCHCIMTWRSYHEGQTAATNAGHPAFSPLVADSGWVHRVIDPVDDWFYQDSLYYGNNNEPLRYYIAPNPGDLYNTGTGFVAYDSLYSIRHQRNGPQESGFFLTYSPTPADLRPDDLAAESTHPLYEFWGYHRKDYHIYLWALMEQLNAKLESCEALSSAAFPASTGGNLMAFPNPTSGRIALQFLGLPFANEQVEVHSLYGKNGQHLRTSDSGCLTLEGLPAGMYLLKSEKGMVKFVIE